MEAIGENFYEIFENKVEWDKIVDDFGGHPLQYWGWGELKANEGWGVVRVKFANGGAQILVKKLPLGQKMFFVPRGPFVKSSGVSSETLRAETLRDLVRFANEKKAGILKIEPEWLENTGNGEVLALAGFHKSQNQVFIPKTAEIALGKWENSEALLASFGKKTRQYINKSLRESEIGRADFANKVILGDVFGLYEVTAARAGFKIHPREYYLRLAEEMGERNRIYGAYSEGKMCAFLWNITSKATEFELYGGSDEIGRRLRANYGLKWCAIKEALEAKTGFYDMNGLLNDGISEFKRYFITENEEIVRVGTWDYYPSVMGKGLDEMMVLVRKIRQKGR